ncbi:MAG: AMP-binding protein [Ilumatobacteraceae bacterium]
MSPADLRRLDEPIRVATDETLVLPTLLRHRAEHDGDRPFLQEVTGREQTYAELDESARRWAAGLHALGVQPGEHVAVLLPPCLEAHHVWIGASRIGARDAPLNPAYRGHLLRHTLNGSRAGCSSPAPTCSPRSTRSPAS